MTGDVNARRCAYAYGNLYRSLPGDVRAHHGLFRARAFETPATIHKVAKSYRTVQGFIQANQKTSPSPLLIKIAVIPSILTFSRDILQPIELFWWVAFSVKKGQG